MYMYMYQCSCTHMLHVHGIYMHAECESCIHVQYSLVTLLTCKHALFCTYTYTASGHGTSTAPLAIKFHELRSYYNYHCNTNLDVYLTIKTKIYSSDVDLLHV